MRFTNVGDPSEAARRIHRRKTAVNSLQRLQSPPNSFWVTHDSSASHSWSCFKTHLHRERIKGRQSLQPSPSEAIDRTQNLGLNSTLPFKDSDTTWDLLLRLKLLTLGVGDSLLLPLTSLEKENNGSKRLSPTPSGSAFYFRAWATCVVANWPPSARQSNTKTDRTGATCPIFWTIASVFSRFCPLFHRISTILQLATEVGDRYGYLWSFIHVIPGLSL